MDHTDRITKIQDLQEKLGDFLVTMDTSPLSQSIIQTRRNDNCYYSYTKKQHTINLTEGI